jgi:murein DD-endopeptidase MepM/ murein hydrolase activator NlpD
LNRIQDALKSKLALTISFVVLLIIVAVSWHKHPLRIPAPQHPPQSAEIPWQQYLVKKGDSFSAIMHSFNINYSTTMKILKLKHSKTLSQLSPGDNISLQAKDNTLLQLQTPIDRYSTLTIRNMHGKFSSEVTKNPVKIMTRFTSGEVENSIAASFSDKKIPAQVLAKFEKIFSWKVDFKKDMRSGASFAIIYEEQQTTGPHNKTYTSNGPIILAQLINNKKNITALRYTTKNGKTDYYDSEGNSLSGKFLKAPLHYTHVSSKFSLRRWHPILHEYRPHFGVDLAAPMNTPIRAAADGRITLHRNVKGYGRTIYIRHNFEYTTRYAHMHAYAKNLKTGSHVKKGEIIGYVGKSGLATGPHLHYEIRKFGIPRNPMTLPLPSAAPVPHQEHQNYLAFANRQIAALQNDERHFALLQKNKTPTADDKHG